MRRNLHTRKVTSSTLNRIVVLVALHGTGDAIGPAKPILSSLRKHPMSGGADFASRKILFVGAE